jgi:hypothetical protein
MQVAKFSLTSHAETSNAAFSARQAGKSSLSKPPAASSQRLNSGKYNTAGGMNQWNKTTFLGLPCRRLPKNSHFSKRMNVLRLCLPAASPAEAVQRPHL